MKYRRAKWGIKRGVLFKEAHKYSAIGIGDDTYVQMGTYCNVALVADG